MTEIMSTRRRAGFTLIELITTIAVASILLSLAIPGVRNFTMNARQAGSVNEFVSAIHLARNTAITTNSRVTVCASSGGANCEVTSWEQGWIVFVDDDSDQAVDPAERIIGSGDGSNALDIDSAQFGRFFMFRPNGRVMNAAITTNTGEFTVCDERGSSYARVVIVDISGRPRLSKIKANGTAPACS
ncbi:MAG: GspH/FimT family pseudopilin [Gammaproteobacteria bacterium]|nr:GspH/FimT family pseudopilin [Gammaproteobacteria bacterium]